jgi:hypothetical protein
MQSDSEIQAVTILWSAWSLPQRGRLDKASVFNCLSSDITPYSVHWSELAPREPVTYSHLMSPGNRNWAFVT